MSQVKHDIERILNQARIKLPGASDAGIKGELFDVLNEFFGETSSWMEAISINILPNTTEYEVTPAEGGQIIRLAGVVDKNKLPQPAIMPSFGLVSFRDPYNVAQTFIATVVKNVSLPTTKDQLPITPDFVYSVYGTTILDGLLGRMMSQLNKSYSNDTLGTYHLKKFSDGIAMARVATLRANTFGTQRWHFPGGWRGRGQRGGVSVGANTGQGF